MATKGSTILGIYSPSCEKIRTSCPVSNIPHVGDIVFFAEPNKNQSNHAGLIYKVTSSTIYTVEGDTSGQSGLVTNGECVATKSYSKTYSRILSYGSPKYTSADPSSKVIDIALGEVGYLDKRTNSKLDERTANAGAGNFTKYGKWAGANGATWSGSFISWCFCAAYDGTVQPTPQSTANDSLIVNPTVANSSLVNYVNRLSTSNCSKRTENISCITVHSAKQIGDIYDLAVMLNSSDKCYNYGIDNSGTIGLFVDEALATNSSNSKSNDNRSVNIICMNSTDGPSYQISDQCYQSLVKLCEDICRRNFIFELKFTNNPSRDTMTYHYQFNSASECPGEYIMQVLVNLRKEVNSRLNVKTENGVTTVSARLASSQTEALKAQSTVAVKSIKPYVLQPASNMLNVDYAMMKQLGVVGVMLDAGQRFNENHELVEYRTATIYKQTLEVNYANLPHAYIYTTRARSSQDVKEEARWFYYVVSKYPPKLGVWLHCRFDKASSSDAQSFVDEWYNYFVKWGLKSKCGLYATKKQASKIGWPAQCAYMPLWLEGEFSDSVCPDEELLTPSFFKLDDLTNKSGKNYAEIQALLDDQDTGVGNMISSTISSVSQGVNSLQNNSQQSDSDKATTSVNQNTNTLTVNIPKSSNYTGLKAWTSYTSIRPTSTQSYAIVNDESAFTDSNGLRLIDGRYLIASPSGISSTIGTYVDLILQNGTVIECIVGQAIPDNQSDSTNHLFTDVENNYTCAKFLVYNSGDDLNPEIRQSGDCSYAQDNWKSPIKSAKVYTKNWFVTE